MNLRTCLVCLGFAAALHTPAPAHAGTLLVKDALLITMKPGQEKPFLGYMLVGEDGRIASIAEGSPPPDIAAGTVIDAQGKIVAPGFVSAHSHLFMSPLRGLGHSETLYGWIHAFSRLTNRATADDIYWFSLHGSLDFLRNGITTAYDFIDREEAISRGPDGGALKYPAPVVKPVEYGENQLRAKADAGLRFINSVWLLDSATKEEALRRLELEIAFAKEHYSQNPLFLKMALSGSQQFSPTRATAALETYVMKHYGLMNQSHFLESPDRISEQQEKFWWYVDAGTLGPDFIFGHFIQTTPQIVRVAAQSGASMSWQPSSNSRLASGVADIPLYREFGMKVAVGLDDQSCTDISDPFQNMRIGLALIRTKYKDARSLSVYDMLFLHTLSSAQVLHIADKVGSLEPGKYADFLVVDPRSPDTGPLHDALATYVLACGLRNLKAVYVGGRQVASGDTLLTYDETIVRREVDTRIARLQAEAAAAEAAAH